jgi:hypothetical protein
MPRSSGTAVRRSERLLAKLPIKLRLKGQGIKVVLDAVTVDLSPHGARVRVDAAMARGQPVEVMPMLGRGSVLRSRVAWIGAGDSSLAGHVGLEFLSPLPRWLPLPKSDPAV